MLIDSSKKAELTNSVSGYKSRLTIRVIDSFKEKVERETGGRNTVIYDNNGIPHLMVVIPRMNYEQLNLPEYNLGTGVMSAFVTNGVPRSEVLIGKYLSDIQGCNLPGLYPTKRITLADAKNIINNKGPNWHCFSVHEWALLCFLNIKANHEMRGNNYMGGSWQSRESGVRLDNQLPFVAATDRADAIIRNGSAPNSFSHDGTPEGVFDVVGQGWEWIDQIETRNGQLFTTLENNANDVLQGQALFFDSVNSIPNTANVDRGAVKLSSSILNAHGPSDDGIYAYARVGRWFETPIDPSYVPNLLMRRLLMEYSDQSTSHLKGSLLVRNNGVRSMMVGGDTNAINVDGALSAYAHLGARIFTTAPDDETSYTVSNSYVFRVAYHT